MITLLFYKMRSGRLPLLLFHHIIQHFIVSHEHKYLFFILQWQSISNAFLIHHLHNYIVSYGGTLRHRRPDLRLKAHSCEDQSQGCSLKIRIIIQKCQIWFGGSKNFCPLEHSLTVSSFIIILRSSFTTFQL